VLIKGEKERFLSWLSWGVESGAVSLPAEIGLIRWPSLSLEDIALPAVILSLWVVSTTECLVAESLILHGLRRWWDRRGELRGGGQRVSRHYYDVHRLLASDAREGFAQDSGMAADCVQHDRMFFNRPDFDLAATAPGNRCRSALDAPGSGAWVTSQHPRRTVP
jgi:hypothetical protein